MSDRIAVMDGGGSSSSPTRGRSTSSRGPPFVADFIGTSNTIGLTVNRREGELAVMELGEGDADRRPGSRRVGGTTLQIRCARRRSASAPPTPVSGSRVGGRVVERIYLGSLSQTVVELASGERLDRARAQRRRGHRRRAGSSGDPELGRPTQPRRRARQDPGHNQRRAAMKRAMATMRSDGGRCAGDRRLRRSATAAAPRSPRPPDRSEGAGDRNAARVRLRRHGPRRDARPVREAENPDLELKVATFDSNKSAAAKLAGGFEADVVEVCTDEMAAAARARPAAPARPERRDPSSTSSPSPTPPRSATTPATCCSSPPQPGPTG